MQYVMDSCISAKIVAALQALGEDVVHRGHATDTSWIASAVQANVIIITVDLAPKNLPGKTMLEKQRKYYAGKTKRKF